MPSLRAEQITEPAWIQQARQLHDLLTEQAEHNEYQQLVWQGKLFNLYKETGAPNGNYSRIIKLLETHEVIRFVQRGNRYQSTIIEITGKLRSGDLLPPEHLTAAAHAATVRDTERGERLQALEAWRESLEKGGLDVAKVLQDFELRITRLERELGKHAKKAK